MKKVLLFTGMMALTSSLSAQTISDSFDTSLKAIIIAEALISVIVLFTFLSMAGHVKRIMLAIEYLTKLENNKEENQKEVTCKHCGEVQKAGIFDRDINCNKCGYQL